MNLMRTRLVDVVTAFGHFVVHIRLEWNCISLLMCRINSHLHPYMWLSFHADPIRFYYIFCVWGGTSEASGQHLIHLEYDIYIVSNATAGDEEEERGSMDIPRCSVMRIANINRIVPFFLHSPTFPHPIARHNKDREKERVLVSWRIPMKMEITSKTVTSAVQSSLYLNSLHYRLRIE